MIRPRSGLFLVLCASVHAGELTSLLVDAQTQFQESHYEQALKLYKQARDQSGNDASVEYNIGLCHLRLGDADKATQHFEGVASRADAGVTVRRDALFNVGVIRASGAKARLEALLNPDTEEGADTPPPPADSPQNIEALKAVADELLGAIALFRECERIEPSEDAQHNMRAVRITRRNVLGLLKRAVEAKEKEDMLNDPPAYLEVLIGQQRTVVGLTRRLILDPPENPAAQRDARRSVLRLQRQIMERTGTFADHLAQFVESAEQTQASPAEGEETPREQVYHAAAEQLEHSIERQRDASAYLMDGELAPSFDEQVAALDQMHVALRLFPKEPQQALVQARTEQTKLREMVSNVDTDSDWLQDLVLGRAPLPESAALQAERTALHYDQSQVLTALTALQVQFEQIAAMEQPEEEAGVGTQETPPMFDPELNRALADALGDMEALRADCLNAIDSRDKNETLSVQQDVLDRIDAALDLLPKTIEQRIAELAARQARLNEMVRAEADDVTMPPGQQGEGGLDELRRLAADARSDVLGGPPAQVGERVRAEQDDIHVEAQAVNEEMREQIPTGNADMTSPPAGSPDAQSEQVQAYIEASKHLEQADFEMLVAIEGLDKAIVQDTLAPMASDGPVQVAQASALEELLKALAALRPPQDQQQCDQEKQQDQQQQQQEQEDQGSENARRAVERADQEREQAERQLYQRRPRTVIKDW
ncbi:MAG: hypothetical protein PVI86_13610 [Phycisphaerae bacterium]|jgi:hypothetical protein